MKMPNPVVPSPRTSPEKTGPSGTSIPPPMSPVAKPMFTPRTTGLMKMKCQPSAMSLKTSPRSMRRSSPLRRRMWSREMGRLAMIRAAMM